MHKKYNTVCKKSNPVAILISARFQRIIIFLFFYFFLFFFLIFFSSAYYVSNGRRPISDQIYNLLFVNRGYTLRVMTELIY